MEYKIVPYIADQIIGHLKAGMPRIKDKLKIKGILEIEGSAAFIKADYPSTVKKPCDVHILYRRDDPSFFSVRWSPYPEEKKEHSLSNQNISFDAAFAEAVKEIEEMPKRQEGHITVWVKDLGRAWASYFEIGRRCKRAKRKRADERRWSKLQNVIMVRYPLPEDTFSLRDELCLQIGCYLAKDDILDHDAKLGDLFLLFQKYAKQHFPGYWKTIEDTQEGIKAFNNICNNFQIPRDNTSFKMYVGMTLFGMAGTIDRNTRGFRDTSPKKEHGSTFYSFIYAGRVQAKKEKGRYVDIPVILEQIEKLQKQKEVNQSMAQIWADKRGISYKSAMRSIQRWRKQELSQEGMLKKILGDRWQEKPAYRA